MTDSADHSGKRDLYVLLVLSPLLIAGCLNAPFLNFDDQIYIDSPILAGTAPWYDAFDDTKMNGSNFPLPMLSLLIEHKLYVEILGINRWAGFVRFDNLLLHAAAAVSLWYIFRAFRFGRGALLLTVGAFLLQPMACESVCWATERKNCLVGALGFGALSFAICCKSKFRIIHVATLFTLAMISKPSALGLLPVLLLWEIWQIHRLRQENASGADNSASLRGRIFATAGLALYLCILTAAIVRMNLHTHALMLLPPPGGSTFTAILTDAEILRRYMQHLLLPIGISFAYYVEPITSITDPRFWLNAIAIVAVVATTTWLSKRREWSAFLWFWFFAAVAPNMNVPSTAFLMQDRYIYLSTPAFWGALTLGLEGLAARASGKSFDQLNLSRAGLLALWGILLAFGTGALMRGQAFINNYTLFHDAVIKQPGSALANLTYGITLTNMADHIASAQPEQAEEFRSQAAYHLELTSKLPDRERLISPGHYYAALGYVQFKRGKYGDAEAAARQVIEGTFPAPVIPSVKVEAYSLLAQISLQRKSYDEAFNFAKLALATANVTSMDVPEVWMTAGEALEGLRRNSDAITAYSKVIKGMPGYEKAQFRIKELQSR
jgi:tetratricopeptide (TPR) repeat protein